MVSFTEPRGSVPAIREARALGEVRSSRSIRTPGSFDVVHAFETGTTGANPNGLLALAKDGNYYGVARNGGAGGAGTIFKVDPRDSGFEVVYAFATTNLDDQNPEGAYPGVGLTVGSDGLLYGAACWGGAQGAGTIFRLDVSTRSVTSLHSFDRAMRCPSSKLLQASDGNLYGTTMGELGTPVIFRVTPSGGFSVLYTFDAPQRDPLCSFDYTNEDGMRATGTLVEDSAGDLYGTAESGGLGHSGTVFVLRGAIKKDSGTGSSGGSGGGGGGGSLPPIDLCILGALLLTGRWLRRADPAGCSGHR